MARKSNTEATSTEATTDAAAPRTTEQKLAAARALVAKYEQEIVAERIRNDIREGDFVTFIFGRAEKKRTLEGTIVGIKNDETQGLLLRVQTGEGFDVEVYKVNVRDLTSNVTQDARNAVADDAAPVDADPLAAGE